MSLTVRGRPVRFSLAWLKPPPVPPEGNMTLFEHLRELRYRLVMASVVIVLGSIACGFFYTELFDVLQRPYRTGVDLIRATGKNVEARSVINGVAQPMTLAFKVCVVGGLVLSSPLWLYQLWSFIMPGLLSREKKWSLIFIGAATPLFLTGVALGYYVMPKGIAVMLSFTPGNASILNLVDVNYFLGFMLRVMMVFGASFLLPLIVVMLNLLGVVKARQLTKARSYVIFGIFVFSAIATPTVDPVSMLLLSIPMTVLFIVAEVIAHGVDRGRARRATESGDTLVMASGKTVEPAEPSVAVSDGVPIEPDQSPNRDTPPNPPNPDPQPNPGTPPNPDQAGD